MLTNSMIKVVKAEVEISSYTVFNERWNNYANIRNDLAIELENANIDVLKLKKLIEAVKKVEQIGFLESYRLGYSDARKQYQN